MSGERGLPLRTPSLVLRHFTFADAADLLRLNGEPSTRRWLPSHVYADLPEAEEAVAFLMACYASPGDARGGPYVLGMELRRTGHLIGHVGFSPLRGDVEVSYAVAESERGQGYGAEALTAACRWAAETFRLPGVVANTASANAASRRVLEAAGFVHLHDEDASFQGTPQRVSRYRWDAVS